MIRCRKCGITYKDSATLCLRCMNPLPKPSNSVTVRKPVRKEVLENIITRKKDPNLPIATASPRPLKMTSKTNFGNPLQDLALIEEASKDSSPENPDQKNVIQTENHSIFSPISESPNISTVVKASNESFVSGTPLSSSVSETQTQTTSTENSIGPITSGQSLLEKNKVKESLLENDISKETTLTINKSNKLEIDKDSFINEVNTLSHAIKGLDPSKTIEAINPHFGEIRVDEAEKLFNIISELEQSDMLYARTKERILFDRGYLLQGGYITHLNIFSLGISKLPENLSSLRKLSSLDLERNNFQSLPEGLDRISGLESLNVSENKLKVFSNSLDKLNGLKYLWLYDNEITKIPQTLSSLTNLEHLDLRGNKLTSNELDPIYELKKLRFLSLESNNIATLSENLDSLTDLEVLLLGNNPIEILPDISSLKNLKELGLYGTKLTYVPESILFLPNLHTLDIWSTAIKQDWVLMELKNAGVNIRMDEN